MEKVLKMTKHLYGLLSLLSLVIGMGIYLCFRNLNIVLFEWIPKPYFLENIFVPIPRSVLSSMLLFNLPDALWFLSGILFLRFIWFYEKKWQSVYIVCFYGIATIIEISQLSEKVPGTFDVLDLLFEGITAFIEGLLYNIFVRRSSV
jgi:hypothetical protein